MTEREIIAGLGKGDWKSYTILYEQYYNQIRFFAYKYVSDLDIAHELTNEAFIKLWKKRGNFQTVQNVQAFLFITTKNACLNHIKQLKRRKAAHEEILYVSNKESDNNFDEEVQSELIKVIFRESDSLSKTCRRIIQLHYGEGLTYKEIAEQLEISVENVRVQHANAVNTLRMLLKRRNILLLAGICMIFFM